MAYTLLPGVMQGIKLNGQPYLYQHGRYPNGKTIQVPYTAKVRVDPMMERVTVHSLGYEAWVSLEPKDEKMAALKAAILAKGPTYESCRFFHQGEANASSN